MILSEDTQGFVFGIITFGTNLPYPILMQPS
jgi:hypothetical protein